MACGCPVITSNVTSLPEVVGESAILVNPDDEEEIGRAILQVILDASLQEELKDRGLQRAKGFKWEMTANKTREIYEQA